jgi:hypothetical protein
MKEIKIKAFLFQELQPEVQKKVIEWYREYRPYEFQHVFSDMLKSFARTLEEYGYPSDDIRYRFSYSQGDGIAFYGKIETANIFKILQRVAPKNKKLFRDLDRYQGDVDLSIVKSRSSHLYDHYNTMIVEANYDYVNCQEDREDLQQFDNLIAELEELIGQDIKRISLQLEAEGYSEIEYQTSDEVLAELLVEMEYLFSEQGDRIDLFEREDWE